MAVALRYAVRSDKGLVRGNNEDAVYAGPRLLAIADGMGGHAAGEVASTTVITALERLDEDHPVEDLLGELRRAFEQANHDVAQAVETDPHLDGMGTTLTALRFSGSRVGLVHVGDSRAYLARGGTFAQITHDDTYVQSLVDSGRLTEEEAAHHPRKSVILRAITGAAVEPDVSIREARVGDRYLLCSDGLSDVVSAETLAETLMTGDPQECADRLVELALRGGGPDNVTCIVADVVDADAGGWGDDVPVIGGALDVNDGQDGADTDRMDLSSAERASAMMRPPGVPGGPAADGAAPSGAAATPHRTPRRWRTWALAVVATAVVVGVCVGSYLWTQGQYYVGESGQKVAVFRGVNSSLGPLRFSQVEVSTDLDVADLTAVARSQVRSGIAAASRADASRIVDRLTGQLLPLCPTAGATPSTTGTATGATATTGAATTVTASATPSGTPTSGVTDGDGASASGSPSGSLRPGVDCREGA